MTAKSGITQEELIKWGGADVFNQALALCNSGLVKKRALRQGHPHCLR